MTDPDIKAMLHEIICTLDFDLYKYFLPEYSENIEQANAEMRLLVMIVRKYLPRS